eukprot:GSChrysophyteH1.ASY1.ANO1.2836.1 assembled CDS
MSGDVESIQLIWRMLGVFAALGVTIYLLCRAQIFASKESGGNFLPDGNNQAKREFEIYALKYTTVWIGIFGLVVVTKVYEQFDSSSYMILCVSLSLPYLLQPIVYPLPAEKNLPLHLRYSFKANVWIAIFSFIGNYWYTHYFYSVLQAFYDFPSLRLNNVPILVLAFSYFTAFMETLTISSYEHYGFNVDRSTIYSIGSAFYGIYFIVSYPVFYRLDEKIDRGESPHSLYNAIMEALGSGMLVLCLLDFCRLYLGVKLVIPGVALCENDNMQQCVGL